MIRILEKDLKRLPRSNEFNSLRFILASIVLFTHSGFHFKMPLILELSYKVQAVPLFLYLSGFLVSESLYFSNSLFKYFEKRVRRILPGYFVVVFLGGLIFFMINIFSINQYGTNLFSLLKYYFHSFLFLDTKYPCVHNVPAEMNPAQCAVNGSLWTIKYELFFYTLLPFIFFLGKLMKFFFPILTIASLILLKIYMYNAPIYLTLFFCFLCGTGFSMSRKYWMNIYGHIKISSLNRFFIVALITIFSGNSNFIPLWLSLPLLTFFCLFPKTENRTNFNPLRFGDLSYGIYLLHWPIIIILNPFLININFPKILLPFLILIISSIGSFILYEVIEKRFLQRKIIIN